MFPSNTIVLAAGQKQKLQELAMTLGVTVTFHSHQSEHIHMVSGQQYTSVATDQWFVDMMEKLVERVVTHRHF